MVQTHELARTAVANLSGLMDHGLVTAVLEHLGLEPTYTQEWPLTHSHLPETQESRGGKMRVLKALLLFILITLQGTDYILNTITINITNNAKIGVFQYMGV